ncbi:transferase [Trypanosoma conorhini]|uniref:Transferase n=1 Tax=Trypanosoma conorhini TaxID=83891 RepID=A0A422Q8E1_9TRYP|nr:transferase [Trypanosoma conorhini]RNF26226.1 transferase [Trypanosoma conorhini]
MITDGGTGSVTAANAMSYAATGPARTKALERHMRQIQQGAPAACINRAQCALVALRLQHIFHTLSRLADASPSLQLLTVFAAADLLVRRMWTEGWKTLLLSHFTCVAVFTGLFERIKRVWRLHSTASWTAEHKAAIGEDEVENAAIYVGLVQGGACLPTPCVTNAREGSSLQASGLTVEQVIHVFRRHQLGGWKVPFEELTPPNGATCREAAPSRNAHLVFDVHSGYRYRGKAVVLHELEEVGGQRISPENVMIFVQDMATRVTWSHPNLVPFIGAFTEKMSPHDGDVSSASATPTPALGIIMEDVTAPTAQAAVDGNPHGTGAVVYRSLHEILFVQRRRFTIREAVGVTLQVADALHYILMDEMQVPFELAAAWLAVSPSNTFFRPISRAGEAREVQLPDFGDFAVMYAPPVYVEGGPFSRWLPHPHAASPVSYVLTQLFLALVRNEPPYRLLERQADLAACVFNAAEDARDNTAAAADDAADGLPFVKVSVPVGSVIPAGLPAEMRGLCQRGLLLRHPCESSKANALSLVEFRSSMYALYEGAPDTPCELAAALPEQQTGGGTVHEPASPQGAESCCSVEMTSVRPALDDYGELCP